MPNDDQTLLRPLAQESLHTTAPAAPRSNDRFTWSMYLTFALWGWVLYMFGPATQLLGSERGLSDTLIGLHSTALAVGACAAGLLLPRVVPALGRRTTLLVSGALMVAGLAVFVASPALVPGLLAVVVMSTGGTLGIGAGTAGLALHHGPRAGATLTVGNGLGTVAGVMGPLVLGAAVAAGFGWRAGLLTAVPLAGAALFVWARIPAGDRAPRVAVKHGDAPARERLTLGLDGWLLLVAALAGTAVEFATTFWAASLIQEATGASVGVATGSIAGFVGGMALIRLISGPATRRWPARWLVAGSFVAAAAGWAVLWTAQSPAVAIAGLVLAGLGVGLLWPLCGAMFLATARGPVDSAQSVMMVASSVAVGVVPFLLGALADQAGVHTAFLIIPVFVVLGIAGVLLGSRARR
ncbi:MFS transporter [Xylanimonas sp. McL0601]|uniref:MFS transporter n=1 Tax=Xylanimonas sp. McL0601 TaxID=3414739 RepID=UPI003CF3C249